MVTLDLAKLSVRDANAAMRAAGARGEDIEIVNPDARHHLGVGLIAPVAVRIRGSAGYFCAGLSHGARFEVDSNVGWGVGDNLYAGSVVVGGNASAIAAVALRGGEVVVKGDIGSRAVHGTVVDAQVRGGKIYRTASHPREPTRRHNPPGAEVKRGTAQGIPPEDKEADDATQ